MPKIALHTAHDNRSIAGEIVASPKLDCFRFKYNIEGSAIAHYIDLPKRMFAAQFIPGAGTILSVVITQAATYEVPDTLDTPGLVGLNGHKLS